MGAEIYMFAEVKRNNKWEKVGDIYQSRNYVLFSILANVRNDGDEKVAFISEPRGLPSDVSDNVAAEAGVGIEDFWPEFHSHSYLTLQEIKNFDWNKTARINDEIVPYKEWCRDFFEETIPRLEKLGAPDVRIVFWFEG